MGLHRHKGKGLAGALQGSDEAQGPHWWPLPSLDRQLGQEGLQPHSGGLGGALQGCEVEVRQPKALRVAAPPLECVQEGVGKVGLGRGGGQVLGMAGGLHGVDFEGVNGVGLQNQACKS